MKKLYKVDSYIAGKQQVNTGLVDATRALRIDYQQSMHKSLSGTELSDAFTGLQQDLTRVAKFKTNIEVKDLVYLFYFKLDIITDLLEMRRVCRALETRQDQKKDSSRRLAKFLKGQNPLLYKFTPENMSGVMSDFRSKWNSVFKKVNDLLPMPRIEEFYRRAFFADSIFKDYKAFGRSPLIAFSRKYTCNFATDADNIAMTQSTATSSGSELPLDALELVDVKITDYLNNEGNYICGLLRKISTAGGFKPDSGFWQEWKEGDTVAINDAADVEEIIQNVWIRYDRPDTFTKEQVTSTFYGGTGEVVTYTDTNVGQRAQILAGKFIKDLSGAALCDAMQMNLLTNGATIDASTGMVIMNLMLYTEENNGSEVYNADEFTAPDDDLQYFHQKFIHLMPNVTVKLTGLLGDKIEYIINHQGEWRFECDSATMSSLINAFNVSILKVKLDTKREE